MWEFLQATWGPMLIRTETPLLYIYGPTKAWNLKLKPGKWTKRLYPLHVYLGLETQQFGLIWWKKYSALPCLPITQHVQKFSDQSINTVIAVFISSQDMFHPDIPQPLHPSKWPQFEKLMRVESHFKASMHWSWSAMVQSKVPDEWARFVFLSSVLFGRALPV